MRYLKRTGQTRKRIWMLVLAVASLLLTGLSLNRGVTPAQAGQAAPTESQYIEVVPGQLPLVIGIPHGGRQAPSFMPDRQQAVILNDQNSQAAGKELAAALAEITGKRPTLVINQLDRAKLDPNRGLIQGAQGDPTAETAWWSYHESIEAASRSIESDCSRGLYLEVHSHGGDPSWIQIGYGLDAETLSQEDEILSKRRYVYQSNIRALTISTGSELASLLRGPSSLGARLQAQGYATVPSPLHPTAFEGYFDGGYSVYRHGSRHQGEVDSLQVEIPYRYLEPNSRASFIRDFAQSVVTYMVDHYQWDRSVDGSFSCAAFADVAADNWAHTAIESQYRAGKIQICANAPRRFCPQEPITRGEAVEWLWANIGEQGSPDPGGAVFADLQFNTTAAQAFWNQGIVEACLTEPLRFCPQAELNRAQLARWLLKARFGPSVVPASPSGAFSDITKSDWDGWWVEQAYQAGFLRPCATSGQSMKLCPQQSVSRSEWAWALAQAIDHP